MNKLDQDFKKARSKYLRCIRLRQDVASTRGARWDEMNDKLIVAEENYHRLGSRIHKRDSKKLVKKVLENTVVVENPVTKSKKVVKKKVVSKKRIQSPEVVKRKTTYKGCKNTSTSAVIISGGNDTKSIWDF